MNIYIQSKSGNLNSTTDGVNLMKTMKALRTAGGYYMEDGKVFVPFEEILFLEDRN